MSGFQGNEEITKNITKKVMVLVVVLTWPFGFASVNWPASTVPANLGGPNEEIQDEELLLKQKGAFRLGTTRFRHGDSITSLAFVGKGDSLVSASYDGTVRLWEVNTGKEIRKFRGEKIGVLSVAVSSDDSLLAAGTTKVIVWNRKTGAKTWQSPYLEDTIDRLAFSPDTSVLASSGFATGVILWEGTTGKEVFKLPRRPGLAGALSFSPDGSLLAYSTSDKTLRILATKKNKELFVITGSSSINSVAFSPDGKILATASGDLVHKEPGEVTLWDSAHGKKLKQIAYSRFAFESIAFLPAGNSLVGVGQNNVIHLWDIRTGELIRQVKVSSQVTSSISPSPDGKLLAFGGLDSVVGLLDLASGKITQIYEGHQSEVNTVAISADNKLVVSGSSDNTVRAWDNSTRKELWRIPVLAANLMCIAIAPNAKMVASGSGHVDLWDLFTGKLIRKIKEAHLDVRSLDFSPDGEIVASGDAIGTISIAQTQSGRHLAELGDPDTRIVCSICFSPNGKVLASGRYSGLGFPSTDGIIQLWDVVTRKKMLEWDTEGEGIASLRFSPDGKKIASVSKKIASVGADRLALKEATVSFWDSVTGKRAGPLIKSPTSVLCVAFSPDGNDIATGHEDHVIRIWAMNQGKEKCQLSGHQGPVRCLAFSKDGKFLVSGSKDTSIIVWDLAKVVPSSKEK